MLTIERSGSSLEVCPHCEDTGVVLPKMRKLLTEFGEFCSCPIGVERWETTKEMMADIEHDLAALPSLPPPPPRPNRESSRSFRVG